MSASRDRKAAGVGDALRLERQLCFALYSAQRALTRAYAPLLAPLELTYPQYVVMLVLWERDGRPVHELGSCLALDSGTLTPLLKRLEDRGLVARRREAADERVVRIHLTTAGHALRAKAKHIPHAIAAKAGFTHDLGSLERLRAELVEVTARLESAA